MHAYIETVSEIHFFYVLIKGTAERTRWFTVFGPFYIHISNELHQTSFLRGLALFISCAPNTSASTLTGST